MGKYECTVCGYVYDPADGDPDNGIDPGTEFEDLPDDWVCPVCGATKDQFERIQRPQPSLSRPFLTEQRLAAIRIRCQILQLR